MARLWYQTNYDDILSTCETRFVKWCFEGKIIMLKGLMFLRPTIRPKLYIHSFETACMYGRLNVAQWIRSIYPEIDNAMNSPKYSNNDLLLADSVFCDVCSHGGHIETAEWLLQQYPIINISRMNYCTFREACIRGYLDVAVWLYCLDPNGIHNMLDTDTFDMYFQFRPLVPHLKVSQWLWSIHPTHIISDTEFVKSMLDDICTRSPSYDIRGHPWRDDVPIDDELQIEMLDWFISILPNKEILNIYYADMFTTLCLYGYLATAKWLMKFKPDIITEFVDGKPFIGACINGHVGVVKWLHLLEPKFVDCYGDNVFTYMVPRALTSYDASNHQYYTCKWLCKIRPWKYCYSHVTCGSRERIEFRICTAYEQWYYFCKYPLWLMSSNSPNKKSIFYRLPKDISMYILAWL